jgi:hypothetical protein
MTDPNPPLWDAPKATGRGFRARVYASILLGIGWIIFVLLYAGFWSGAFNLFQNIVIFFVSLVVMVGILTVMWASYGLQFARW